MTNLRGHVYPISPTLFSLRSIVFEIGGLSGLICPKLFNEFYYFNSLLQFLPVCFSNNRDLYKIIENYVYTIILFISQ